MGQVLTPQRVCQTYSSYFSLFWNFASKALPNLQICMQ